MITKQYSGEYELDRDMSPEERAMIENEIVEELSYQAKIMKHTREVKNIRWSCSRQKMGGKIILTADIELTVFGLILLKLGVIR